MMDEQPKLLANKNSSNGPVFEAAPGWGGKLKSWLGKNFVRVILPAVFAGLVFYGLATMERNKAPEDSNLEPSISSIDAEKIISETVLKGDSKTKLARRAIETYLVNSGEDLLVGQLIFLENKLSQTLPKTTLKVGETVNFKTELIESLIIQAKGLTKNQIQKWQSYAR